MIIGKLKNHSSYANRLTIYYQRFLDCQLDLKDPYKLERVNIYI